MGCVYRLAWLVCGLSASSGFACCDLLHVGDHCGTEAEVAEYMIYLLEAGAFGGVIPVIPVGCRCGNGAVSVADLYMRQLSDAGMVVPV